MKYLVPYEWREVGEAVSAGEASTGEGDRRRQASGITVVELLVVMAIISIIMGLGAYSLGQLTNSDLREDSNRVASAIKYTYSNAAINNTQYRLVFDLDSGQYYTEVSKGPVVDESPTGGALGGSDDFLTEEAQKLADKVEKESDLFADEEENPFGVNRRVSYERVEDAVLKRTKLRSGNRFERIIAANSEEDITEGRASVTFFPNGFQEQVMIVIRGESGAAYTLITEPLTGMVRTYSGEIEIPEDFGVVEEDN